MRSRPSFVLPLALTAVWVAGWPGLLGRKRGRRRPLSFGRELKGYRSELDEHTSTVDATLGSLAETIDRLRHRDVDVDEAVAILQAAEDDLDAKSNELEDMLAPEELHGLHMEYEANLERALRAIVTALRGCGITKLPHRPPEDEEPFIYWKRGHQNIVHARMRMQEVVEVLRSWEPGKPAEVTVRTRLHRT